MALNTPEERRSHILSVLTGPTPKDLGHGTNDPDAIRRAEDIMQNEAIFANAAAINTLRQDTNLAISACLEAAVEDKPTLNTFEPKGSIRHVSRVAAILNELLVFGLKLDPKLISIMCIGDVVAPDFVKGSLSKVFEEAERYHKLIHDRYGAGYEVGGQGLELAREVFFDFVDEHYGFSRVEGLKEKLIQQSAITNGGMGSLSIIASSMMHRAKQKGMHHRFVYPDNSFGTWKNIVGIVSSGREDNTNRRVGTQQKNLLHMSPEDIQTFYQDNPVPEGGIMETWCITPASNPGGTKIDPQMLRATIEEITKYNPNATIILDSVYVRTLKPEVAQELIGAIMDPAILDKIVFVESFSKSHGICGEREGLFFTSNKELFTTIQNKNMTLFAGPGLYKSALLMALCTASDEENEAFNNLHNFWAEERKGLYEHLMQPKFSHLFEEAQPHIVKEQIENPLGLYVFLKLKDGITFKEVARDTHIIGVEDAMAEGNFIRFSVGTITEPTYSKK